MNGEIIWLNSTTASCYKNANSFNRYHVYTCSLKIDCSVIILCCSSSHILWNRSFRSLISWSVFSSSLVNDVHWITISSIRRYSNIGWGAGWASPSRCGGTLMTSRCKLATLFLIVLKWLFKPWKIKKELLKYHGILKVTSYRLTF